MYIFMELYWQDKTWGQFFFKCITAGGNFEFFFKTYYYTIAEEFTMPYYLPIAGGRRAKFMPFPRLLHVMVIKFH